MTPSLAKTIGYLAGTICTVSFLPQALKNKKVEEPCLFIIQGLGQTLWVIYGVLTLDQVVIVFASITVFMNLIILAAHLKNRTSIVHTNVGLQRSPEAGDLQMESE